MRDYDEYNNDYYNNNHYYYYDYNDNYDYVPTLLLLE